MPVLQIDGIGNVEVGQDFLALSPDKQATTVEEIIRSIKPGAAPPPAGTRAIVPTNAGGGPIDVGGGAPTVPNADKVVQRSSILPLGKTAGGDTVFALPEFADEARNVIVDLLDRKRNPEDITGAEIFNLGMTFGGMSAASGTGKGIAQAAARATPEELRAMSGPGIPGFRSGPKTAPVAEAPAIPAGPALAVAERTAADAITPAAAPVAAEAAGPTVAEAVKPPPGPKPPVRKGRGDLAPEPQTKEQMKAAAKSFYKEAEDVGLVLEPQSVGKVASEAFSEAANAGLDPTLHPRATAALKRIAEVSNEPVTFQSMEVLRRVAKAAGASADADERRMAGIIVGKIDDFVQGLTAKDVFISTNDPQVAAKAITKARALWSKVAKLDTIETLVDRATTSAANFSGSGLENALRSEFRVFSKNAAKMHTFDKQEQAAIKKVATGTVGTNIARAAGKLAPTGIVSMGIGGGIGATLGTMLGIGPVAGVVAVQGGGLAARKLATAMTKRSVAHLEDLIKTGDSRMAQEAIQQGRTLIHQLAGQAAVAGTGSQIDRKRR